MPNATSTDRDLDLVRFGAAVKLGRQGRDLSPEEFAAQVGITPRHLNNVESGRTKASNRLYLRIAKALQIDASAVLKDAS